MCGVRASLTLVAIVLACGGRQATEEHEVERGQIPEDVVGPPNVPWRELDHAQRAKFMKRVVLPTMKPLLQAFDPVEFRNVTCTTCHRKGGDFRMPNPALYALPAQPEQVPADKAAWLKFMTSEVRPEMAKLLGLPERDFGCRCHPH